MAIGVLLEFPGGSAAQYDAASRKLNDGKLLEKLADWPAVGLLSHVAGPTANGWRVMDVWQSEADFVAFAERLVPIITEAGFPPTTPQIFPAHNFVRA